MEYLGTRSRRRNDRWISSSSLMAVNQKESFSVELRAAKEDLMDAHATLDDIKRNPNWKWTSEDKKEYGEKLDELQLLIDSIRNQVK